MLSVGFFSGGNHTVSQKSTFQRNDLFKPHTKQAV